MNDTSGVRVAWIYPLSGLAFYLQPVLREFAKVFPETTLFTGEWPGYVPGCENSFGVQIVGKSKFIKLQKTKTGYDRGFHLLSFGIVQYLLNFKPDIIFINGLSPWTIIVLLLKVWAKWKVVLIYSGSSPNVDMSNSNLRLLVRKAMTRHIDAAITNSQAGKDYLVEVLNFTPQQVFARPYQIPDKQALLKADPTVNLDISHLQKPTFLFIGQTIYRKGISYLLEACSLLESQGVRNYSVIVIGDGEQRVELEALTKSRGLEERVSWVGWVEYGKLGYYFQQTDVFVFPTLEDIWGMVALEAMLFGKPVLCSKWAGAEELLVDGECGFIFNPYKPEELAEAMQQLIKAPELIQSMGEKARQLIDFHTPERAAEHLTKVIQFALNQSVINQ